MITNISPRSTSRRGSVLLLTLMIVSLLMVIVLAFVVLVRMELRNVRNQQLLFQARNNARLGAQLALARLQETAGPDTRVTLPASADASVTTLPQNQNWTGVRDSAPFRVGSSGTLEMNPEYSQHLGWLVSSPPGVDPQPDQPVFESPFQPADHHAMLVGPASVLEAENAVAAPVIPLQTANAAPAGSVAYWVSDQASKAQVNLSDPFLNDLDTSNDAFRAMAIQRSGTEAFLENFDPANPLHAALIERAVFSGQLGLLNLSTEDVRSLFHDVTLSSYGLPTNVKRGGLKRDLTPVFQETLANGGTPGGSEFDELLAFQNERIVRLREETLTLPGANPGYPTHVWNAMNAITLRDDQSDDAYRTTHQNRIFPHFSDMTVDRDPGGPSWNQLLSWAGLMARSDNSDTGLTTGKFTVNEFNPAPVIARYNLATYWTMDFPTLRVHLIPSIVLWNPYDRPLTARDYYVTLRYETTHWQGYKLNFRVRNPAWNGGQDYWTPQVYTDFDAGRHNNERIINFHLEAEEIPAGAAIIFTMPQHDAIATDSNGDVDTNHTITLTAGLHGGGGYSFYVETDFTQDIRDECEVYNQHNRGAIRWDAAGLPLYTPDLAEVQNMVSEANQHIAVNVNGFDPDHGWEILETVVSLARRNSGSHEETKIWDIGLSLYDLPPNHPHYPRISTEVQSRQPWVFTYEPHGTLPQNLHEEEPDSGIFPGLAGPPVSLPGTSSPFRADQHDGFPFWGLSWGLRLPDVSYQYNTDVQGAGSNLNAPTAWLGHYNPTSPYQGRSGADVKYSSPSTRGYDNIATYIGGFTLDPSYFEMSNFSDDDKHIFIGHSDGVPGGFSPGDIPRAIVVSLPDSVEEFTSIGGLASAPLLPLNSSISGSHMIRNPAGAPNLVPTYPIANSLLHPLIDSDRATKSYYRSNMGPTIPPIPVPYDRYDMRPDHHLRVSFRGQYDFSWILNEMLWDDFIFTPDSNSRLRWEGGLVDRGVNTSAQNVVIEGAFNVNSTSAAAWKSILLGMLDVEIDNLSGETEPNPDGEPLPFARTVNPFGAAYSPESGDTYGSMSNFTGYRRLSVDEVDRLATAIASEVAERGPFLSMADFVNRRLLSAGADANDHRLKGTLQSAIDDAGLNDSQTSASDGTSEMALSDFQGQYEGVSHFMGLNTDAFPGATNRSAPGYFMQSDLLARMGSVLQVRSDTFLIRAYGDVGDPDTPSARAWCEMLVRRKAEYVDPSESADTHPDEVNAINRVFGRRFEVIRFRWLSQNDI